MQKDKPEVHFKEIYLLLSQSQFSELKDYCIFFKCPKHTLQCGRPHRHKNRTGGDYTKLKVSFVEFCVIIKVNCT